MRRARRAWREEAAPVVTDVVGRRWRLPAAAPPGRRRAVRGRWRRSAGRGAARDRARRRASARPRASARAASAPPRSSLGPREDVHLAHPRGSGCSGLSGIGEEGDRRPAPTSTRGATCLELARAPVDRIRHALERDAAGAALHARDGALRHQPRAGPGGDAPAPASSACWRRAAAAEHQQVALAGAAARAARARLSPRRRAASATQRRRAAATAAFVPRRVGRQDQRGDLRPGGERAAGDGLGGVAPTLAGVRAPSSPRPRRRAPALDIGGQRRIVAAGDRSRGRRRC